MQTVEDLDVLETKSVFLFYTLLGVLRQGIGSFVSFALTIIDSEVVTREFLGPADLPGAQTLRIHELTKVIVIYKDENLVFATFQVMSPCLERLNNG